MRDDVDGVRKGRSRVTLVRARRGFPGGRARPVACEAARFGSTHCWVRSGHAQTRQSYLTKVTFDRACGISPVQPIFVMDSTYLTV